jgi:EpsI family protein
MQEPRQPSSSSNLKTTVLILTGVFAVQTLAYQSFTKVEKVPAVRPLVEMQEKVGSWAKVQEGIMDPEVAAILKADDTLNRTFASPNSPFTANLFIASFRSQRHGAAPHSPKNCLPGSGWTPLVNDRIHVKLNERPEPIEINRYIIQRGDSRSLVLYWYQSRDRVVASEYEAKLYTMVDAMKDNRTDTALVRVVIGLNRQEDQKAAEAAAEDFIRAFYTPLRHMLPS